MSAEPSTTMEQLLGFLGQLEQNNIWYHLEHVRDSIMVEVDVPGERWVIEFFVDGHVEVERFRSDGHIGGEEMIETLFREFSDE